MISLKKELVVKPPMSGSSMKALRALNALVVTLILALGLILGIAAVALAQQAPAKPPAVPTVSYNWTLSWNLTDSRLFIGANQHHSDTIANRTYSELISRITPWYFTAGKTFTLVIVNASDIVYTRPTTASPEPIKVEVTSTANETGGITFNVTITLPGDIEPGNVTANWTVALILRNYGGGNWVVFNVTTGNITLKNLMGNLTEVAESSYLLLPNGERYYLFRHVNGSEATSRDLYFVLPNLHFFYLFVGVKAPQGNLESLEKEERLLAEVKLGTDVTVFGPVGYNETVSDVSRDIYGMTFTGFGPIYYVACLYKGIEKGKVKSECKPIKIYLYLRHGEGKKILVYNYTTGVARYNATIYGIARAYDFYNQTAVTLTAGVNETYYRPALVVAIPAVKFRFAEVRDLLDNAIVENGRVKMPLAYKLYVKWVLETKPQATITAEGKLSEYVERYAVVPIGKYVGARGEAPSFESFRFDVKMYIYHGNAAVFAAKIIPRNVVSSYDLTNVKVALLPVLIFVTSYESGKNASEQQPLAEFVSEIKAYYAYSTGKPIITTEPIASAVSTSLSTAQLRIDNREINATLALFTPIILWHGVYMNLLTSWLVTPTINASLTLDTTARLSYEAKAANYNYTIWLVYDGITVGFGLFKVGYNISETGTTREIILEPVIGKKKELASYYDANATSVTMTVENFGDIRVVRAYVAATVVVYNVQFLTLCNETIKDGTVRVKELTPGGKVLALPPIRLSPSAPTIRLPTLIGLKVSEEDGVPVIEAIKPKFNFTLEFFGYKMPSVDKDTRKPVYNVELRSGIANIVYFPLVGVNFKVVANTKEEYPLWGFVVSIRSTVTGEEYWRAITNKSGMVYVMYVPINADYIKPRSDIKIVVRTINPAEDEDYEYTKYTSKLEEFNQTYERYWRAIYRDLNYTRDHTRYKAYTIGTRAEYDQGIVVLEKDFAAPFDTTCNYTFKLVVPVASLRIYVTDINGNVLSSVPVYACAIPGKCPAVYYNTTVIIADRYYANASEWKSVREQRFLNLTDFRLIGISWMKPVFERIAREFKRLLDKTVEARRAGKITVEAYYRYWVGNYTFYLAASLLANYSTDSPYAIFEFPSVIPHEGTRYVRIFMPGQKFYVKVYYMGYEVFSQVVPVPKPDEIAIVTPTGEVKFVKSATVRIGGKEVKVKPGSVVIEAAVKPIKFVVVSKGEAYRLNKLYLGLTFTDAFFKVYAYNGRSKLTTTNVRNFLTRVLEPFIEGSGIEARNVMLVLNGSRMVRVDGVFVDNARYENINASYSLAAYVLPNLMGFYVNASKPSIDMTPLYMTAINVTDDRAYFNVTIGIPAYYENHSAVPNATFEGVYKALTNESLQTPTTTYVNGSQQPPVVNREFTYVTISFNYTYNENYTLWKAYVNATKMSRVDKAVLAVYARNDSGWFKAYEINVTEAFKEAMARITPLFVYVNYTKVKSAVESPNELAIVLTVKGKGKGLEIRGGNLSTAFPGRIESVRSNVYTTRGGDVVRASVKRILPNYDEYFGSPFTIVVPVVDGEATIEMPMWAPVTPAYGARIARFWIMATKETRNVGYGEINVVRKVEGLLPIYDVKSYVLLNYIEPSGGVKEVYVGILGEVTVSDKYMPAVGAGTGGTSTLMLAHDVRHPVVLYNVTLRTPGVITLRTTALEGVKVRNVADFPVIVYGFKLVVGGKEFNVGIKGVAVRPNETVTVTARYIYGSSYNYTATWCDMGNFTPYVPELKATVYYMPPNMTFYAANGTPLPFLVFGNGTVVIGEKRLSISDLEAPLESPVVPFKTIYAGANATKNITTVQIGGIAGYDGAASWTVVGNVSGIKVASNDTYAVMLYNYTGKVITAAAIEDWNGRPLPHQMIVSYGNAKSPALCAGTGAIAISFTDATGKLIQPIPAGKRYVVYWYDSCLLHTIDKAYPYINIYDTAIATDVETLGNITMASAIKTHVVPATIYLRLPGNEGAIGLLTVVYDIGTNGMMFLAFNVTGTDGSITPIDLRVYPAASQMPPTSYMVVAYTTPTGTPLTWGEVVKAAEKGKALELVPVYFNKFSIQRTVTATASVQSFSLSNMIGKAVISVRSDFGGVPSATVKFTIEEPVCKVYVRKIKAETALGYAYTITPLMPSVKKCEYKAVTGMVVVTDEAGNVMTNAFVLPASPFAARITVTALEWKGIPLGYTKTFYLTSTNASTQLVLDIPAVKLVITPVSQAGGPLGKLATINVTCAAAGKEVTLVSGSGEQTVVVPIPKTGSIKCTISGYSYGKSAVITKELTMADAGKTISITLRIPVSGYYIPGVGFVPVSTLIMIAVLILIVVIIIVILLMEYWRRRGLRPPTGMLGPR